MGIINSRRKGSSFERQVAKMIVDAFACAGIKAEDCYRTPLSGGHLYGSKHDPGDILISLKLKPYFSWTVECKHYRKVDIAKLLTIGKKKGEIEGWWNQVLKSSNGTAPLLIFKQNGSEAFAMYKKQDEPPEVLKYLSPYLVTEVSGCKVRVVRFKRLLACIRHKHGFAKMKELKG